jgi:putative transposase
MNQQNASAVEYRRDEHRVHLVVYHLVWCPARRKPVLTGEIAAAHGWDVLELAVRPDHVHLHVRAWPTTPATDVLKAVKGRTSHDLRERFPALRKLPSLWTRSYVVSTAGRVSSETIAAYIAAQKGLSP